MDKNIFDKNGNPHFWSSCSIRTRLMFLVLMSVLPAIGIILHAGFVERTENIEDAKISILRSVENLASLQDNITASTKQMLMTIAQYPGVQNGDVQACNKFFQDLLRQSPHYSDIAASGPDGSVFAAGNANKPFGLADRRYCLDALAVRDIAVGEYSVSRGIGVPVLPFAFPVINDQDQLQGVVSAALKLEQYEYFLQKMFFPEGSVVGIEDRNGIRLCRFPKLDGAVDEGIGQPLPKKIWQSISGPLNKGTYIEKGVDGIRRIYGFIQLRLTEKDKPYLYIRVGIPEETALSTATHKLSLNLFIFSIAGCFALAATWYLGNLTIATPLKKLVEVSVQMGAGNFNSRSGLSHTKGGEIGLLAQSFDTMASALGRREFERRQSEEAINRLNQQNRLILNAAGEGIVGLDAQGIVTFINPAAAIMTGYEAAELLGQDLHHRIHHSLPDGAAYPPFLCPMHETIIKGTACRIRDEVLWRKDGTKFPVAYSSTPIVQNGKISGAVITFRDISERKKVEQTLREANRFAVETQRIARIGGWKANPYTDYLEWTEGVHEIIEETRDCHPRFTEGLKYFPPQNIPLIRDNIVSCLSTGEPFALETEIITAKGRHLWTELRGIAPVVDGERSAVIGTFQDITERKQSEQRLYESEEKFSKAFKKAPLLMTISTIEEGAYLDVNEEFTEVTGYNSEDAIGKTSVELGWLKAKDREILIHNLKKKGYIEGMELELEAKDKRKIFCLYYGEVINIGGRHRLLSLAQNITERKKAEEEKAKLEAQLQQAQKMEAIGSLAGGIAHDLNNILFPISALSEMLLDDTPPDSPAHNSMEQIYKSAQRGSDLVKQILAFSRQAKPQKLPVRIQPILKDVLELARATLPRNIEITSHIKPDCGMISANTTQVHQIAMNLITNAYHAIEQPGGTINVELKEVVFQRNELNDNSMSETLLPGKYACFTISDTGKGIDQALVSKIFEPYFTTKELGKGTGLGLSVVHGIVKEHGGDIRLYSEVGKGTAFHVYLPLLQDANNIKHVDIIREYPTGCERILLIDDEEPIVHIEQMMLERLGYQVTTRTSSPDALAAFEANPDNFDLVISDRGMPNMTGEQLARELIFIRPEIPIILCTGFSDEKDEKHANAMGIKGILMKPVATGDFAEMVRKVLDEAADNALANKSGQADTDNRRRRI